MSNVGVARRSNVLTSPLREPAKKQEAKTETKDVGGWNSSNAASNFITQKKPVNRPKPLVRTSKSIRPLSKRPESRVSNNSGNTMNSINYRENGNPAMSRTT